MTLPLYDNGIISGLFAGLLFGYALESGGLGSPRKLTAQFTLKDWTVFKVMFTAVLVAATGLWLAEAAGIIAPKSVYIPTAYMWGTSLGGLAIGAGFAIGGYCPGTSAAGFASGRLDAAVFMGGMVIGIWIFSAAFDLLEPAYNAAPGPQGQTLAELFGVPAIVVIVALAVMAAIGWAVAVRLEARNGGPLSYEDVADGLGDSDTGTAETGAYRPHEAV